MTKNKDELAALDAANKERIEEYKGAIQRIASTKDGQYLFRSFYLMSGCALSCDPDKVSQRKMDWWEGRRNMYLTAIRGFLNTEQRQQIERIENNGE